MFDPLFDCSCKVSEIGQCFMKLAINSEHLQYLILTRIDLKKTSRLGLGKANPKLGVKLCWDQFK